MIVSKTYTIHDYLYVPKLDGTETIHQVQGTTTISNGEMYGGSGYIRAFDNTGNWELTMQCKWSSSSCGIWCLIKSDETSRDKNDLLLIPNTIYRHVNGSSTYDSGFGMSTGTYYTVKIVKNNDSISVTANNVTKTFTWSLATSLSTLSVGVDAWGGTRPL